MRKLKLIKPWDLEPVYQKTVARPNIAEEILVPVAFAGPAAPEREEMADERGIVPTYISCRHTNGAPVSGAIFAPVTNPRMG